MSKDKNFERRMIVSKYSNRPPFDLKKPKEAYGILDKIKEYPLEGCRNCCRNMSTSSKNILSNPTRILKTESLNTTDIKTAKQIIPRIIQTFQNLNLSQKEDFTSCKKPSIQTLYRNTRSCKLGKNIPKHKLMKNLLQNLDSEVDSCKKYSAESPPLTKGRLKCKKSTSKKQSLERNEVSRPESCEEDSLAGPCIKDDNMTMKPVQIDKRTSTTGLVWPPRSKELLQYSKVIHRNQMNRKPAQKLLNNQLAVTNCNAIRKEAQFSSDSFLEEPPTKDLPQQCHVKPIKSEKVIRRNVVSIDQLRQRSLEDSALHNKQTYQRKGNTIRSSNLEKRSQEQLKNSNIQKLKSKEKSFVQTQVQKLNKVMTTIRSPETKLLNNLHGGTRKNGDEARNFMGHGDYLRRDEATSNYIGLMHRIRNNVPRIQKSESFGSGDNDWSDTGTEISPERIRFPKETKASIDQRLTEKKIRIPLSKFTKRQDDFRPAIPPKEQQYYQICYDCGEGFPNKRKQDVCKEHPPLARSNQKVNKNLKKTVHAAVNPMIHIPCKNNLLCDKGERHSGPCGYSQTRNKTVY